jgi:universal stress protein A
MATTIRTILVPIDFSTPSEEATRYAGDLATTVGASIVLVHVIYEPFVAGGEWDLYVRDAPEMRERLFSDVRARFAAIVAAFEHRGLHVTTDIRFGPPREGIVKAAKAVEADLIVMSTHGRSGLPHLLLGSVAEHVIRAAHCPVLAVRGAAVPQLSVPEKTTAA